MDVTGFWTVKIEIDSSGESSGIADVVFTRIPAEIIEGAETLNVDAVSGGFCDFKWCLDGVARAVKQAGANWCFPPRKRSKKRLDKKIRPIRQMLSSSGGGLDYRRLQSPHKLRKKPIVVEISCKYTEEICSCRWSNECTRSSMARNLHSSSRLRAAQLQELIATDEINDWSEYLEDFRVKWGWAVFAGPELFVACSIAPNLYRWNEKIYKNEIHGQYDLVSV